MGNKGTETIRAKKRKRSCVFDDDDDDAREGDDLSPFPSSLWDMIANNDDITFTHIIPRLNSNDLKFLHGVNKEARALIKRSSRESDLEKKFEVSEMSSISTLEFVWEHKSLREEVKAPWDYGTSLWAARNGHLHILEYLVERKYDQYNEDACYWAAEEGHLDCLKYLHETTKAPWNSQAVYYAHENNHTECLQYLLENNCPLPFDWRYEGGTLYDSEDEEVY